MKKTINIAIKDLLLAFRDPTALLLMFVAPIVLTMIMGFAFGGDDDGPTLEHIPVVVVNHDEGQFSPFLLQAFQSEDLNEMIDATEMDNDDAARNAVDENKAIAAVIIPKGFSNSIVPAGMLDEDITPEDLQNMQTREKSVVTIYGDPASQISVTVVRSVIHMILTQFNSSITSGEIVMGYYLNNQGMDIAQLQSMDEADFYAVLQPALNNELIALEVIEENPNANISFNWLSYTASGLSILFLMFTMTSSARTILSEKQEGTLQRLLVTPTSAFSVISGKMLGIFLLGVVQMLILIFAGRILFHIQWGRTFDVIIFVILLTAAAASWGIFIAAISKTPGQVSTIGMAVNLIFAALGGSFVPRFQLPMWLRNATLFTPNALGIDGLTGLVEGGTLQTITTPVLGCVITVAVLLSIATVVFRRQYQ